MDHTDELLKVIDQGDAVSILSEKDLVARFNFLLKHQLITITEEKILLTEKGKEAKEEGIQAVLERHELIKAMEVIPEITRGKSRKINWSLIFKNLRFLRTKLRK